MEEHKIRILYLKYNILQIMNAGKDWYNIYIDEELKQYSEFTFYTELKYEKILNAKSIAFKKLNYEELKNCFRQVKLKWILNFMITQM